MEKRKIKLGKQQANPGAVFEVFKQLNYVSSN